MCHAEIGQYWYIFHRKWTHTLSRQQFVGLPMEIEDVLVYGREAYPKAGDITESLLVSIESRKCCTYNRKSGE